MCRYIVFPVICVIFSVCQLRADGPVMGWSSWNTYRVNISDSLIKRQADALVATGLADAGYVYVNIDDGYFGGRDKSGRLLVHPQRFPGGLKPVVDHIHGLGLKAGIYSDAGENTCGNFYDNDTIARGVGLYGHDDADACFFFKEMGFDFIKVDFCGGDASQNILHLDLDEQIRYTSISEAIKATGRNDVKMNVCRWNYPGTWVGSVASSWRISQDIVPHWYSVKDIIRQNLYLSAYCGNGRFNDMDMLEVGRGMGQEEDRTHFCMWCMMSSPLLIGCDLTAIDEPTLSMLKNPELIALARDPLMLQAYPIQYVDGVYVLAKDLVERNGRVRAVAFYNPTDSAVTSTLRFDRADLGGPVAVRDLFSRTDVASCADSMTVDMPPHGCRVFRLEAEIRLDRRLYEAETAYISDYQELENNQAVMTGIYEDDAACSGGAKASWLGGKPDNDLLWRDVSVSNPGFYRLTVTGLTPESRDVYVSVNGIVAGVLTFDADGSRDVVVELDGGYNTVRLYNDYDRMPDIDCMTVDRF